MTALTLLLCCHVTAPLPEPPSVQHYRASLARGYQPISKGSQQPGDYIKRVTVYYGGETETVYYWVVFVEYWELDCGRVRVVYAVFLDEKLFEARAWAGR